MCLTFHLDSFSLLYDLASEKIRHYVLAILLCWFEVDLVIEELFKQTHCIICFTAVSFGCFTIGPINKTYTMCWSYIYCTWKFSCRDWCSIYYFLIRCIINNLSSFCITLWGGRTSILQCAWTWKLFSLINIRFLGIFIKN